MKKLLLAGVAAVTMSYAPAADAALSIFTSINNGGSWQLQASSPNNDLAVITNVAIGTFNVNTMKIIGYDLIGASGTLWDNASVNVSTTGAGSLWVAFAQTNVNLGSGVINFTTNFTGTLANATVQRTMAISTNNNAIATDTIGQTVVGTETDTASVNVTGLFSTLELVKITATGPGAFISIDDSVSVPEPMSIALLGAGLLGLGVARRRKA